MIALALALPLAVSCSFSSRLLEPPSLSREPPRPYRAAGPATHVQAAAPVALSPHRAKKLGSISLPVLDAQCRRLPLDGREYGANENALEWSLSLNERRSNCDWDDK